MTYYVKGSSKYDNSSAIAWLAIHRAGFPSSHYAETGWKELSTSGALYDPFYLLGGDGGSAQVDIGLSGSYRIRITDGGIYGWHVASGAWFSLFGSGIFGTGVTDHGLLGGLNDPNDHLWALQTGTFNSWTGSEYNVLSGAFSGVSGEMVELALYSTISGDFAATSGDYSAFSGDYVSLSGNYLALYSDYNALSGDYVITSGDYVITSGDFVSFSGVYAGLPDLSGDYVNLSGDYVSFYNDYIITSGDYVTFSGALAGAGFGNLSGDFVELSGDFVNVSGDFASYIPTLVEDPSPTLSTGLNANNQTIESVQALTYGASLISRSIKHHFIGELSAASTQAKEFEIARIGIDKANWSYNGAFIVELYMSYYDAGGYKKYSVEAGYGDDGSVHLIESQGISTSMDEFSVSLGSFVVISGDEGYIPVLVNVDYYHKVMCTITFTAKETTDSTPGKHYVYVIENPTGSDIASFSEVDIIDMRHNNHTSDDLDTYHVFGRLRAGYNGSNSDWAMIMHRDAIGNAFALGANPSGDTVLNAASGRTLYFNINNSNQMTLTAAQLNLLATQITSTDGDYYYIFGRSYIGYCGHGDYAAFGHRDVRATGSYALLQNSNGYTYLNAATSQSISFRINNSQVMILSATELNMGDTPITEAHLLLDATPDANADYEGIVLNIDTTGCSTYQAVYCDAANSVLPADADAITTMLAIGVVVATGRVLTHGIIRNDSWAWTAGDPVYVSTTAGGLTQTAPSGSGDIVQVVGIAVGADQLLVNPSFSWVEIA